jgi:uncharacterized protein (TIGR01777 family)
MRVVIAGGTGFLGTPLLRQLRATGHEVFVLTRGTATAERITWVPDGTIGPWAKIIDGSDAVVNLSGESITPRRWTSAQKARIRNSRIDATRSIATAIHAVDRKPAVLLNASAVGYYGSRGDERLTEESPPGTDFLASVCRDWETEALAVINESRVVLLRSAPVLDSGGGVLPQMALPFRLFVGGPVGSGAQYWSWIHRSDWVALVMWTLEGHLSGPLNLAAPAPVTNREFARTLGHVLKRPASLPAPSFALRLLLGEMADVMLFSQRVIPAKAEAAGFHFQYGSLDSALIAALRQPSRGSTDEIRAPPHRARR